MHNEQILLTLIVPIELKDEIVDTLISEDQVSGFSLGKIEGYSRNHSHFNIGEQVEGHRAFYRFEIVIEKNQLDNVKFSLKNACGSSDIHYWLLPLFESGSLNGLPVSTTIK
jgi:nitrogen regulatory protein P-II 1